MHSFFTKINLKDEKEKELLRQIIKLVLDSSNILKDQIPILKRGDNISVNLSAKECASLLANGLFCTFSPNENTSNMNFNRFKTFLKYVFHNF